MASCTPFPPASYKTNYLFATVVAISTIVSTAMMIGGTTQLRRSSGSEPYLMLIAGSMVTVFIVTVLIFKNYLLEGNLYLKCWPFLVLIATGLGRFMYCFFTDRFDDGSGFGLAVVSTIIYIFYVHSTIFRPYRLKKVITEIPTFVSPFVPPPTYEKS